MIRDEYKKSQEIRKKSAKEIEGIKKYGERAYYTMYIKKLTSNLKGFNFNTLFTCILGVMLFVFILILLIYDFSLISKGYVIISISLIALIYGWGLAWVLFVKKAMQKKIKKYYDIIEKIKEKEMEKQKNIYKMYTQNKE